MPINRQELPLTSSNSNSIGRRLRSKPTSDADGSKTGARSNSNRLLLLTYAILFFIICSQIVFMVAINFGSKVGILAGSLASVAQTGGYETTATQNRLLQEGGPLLVTKIKQVEAAIKYGENKGMGDNDNNPSNNKRRRQKQKRMAVKDDNSIWAKPEGWKKYGFHDIRQHFGCKEYAHDQTKSLLELDEWKIFQSAYKQYVDESATFDDTVLPMDGYTLLENENGEAQPPPYHAKQSEGKGRGIFASHDIRKGTLVHDGSKSDLMFPTGMAWRRFIFSLPRNRACDQIDWTWTQRHNGRFRLFSAINISILFNSGGPNKINIQPESATSSKFYATRDIKVGEELLYDYDIYETVWHKVGLQ